MTIDEKRNDKGQLVGWKVRVCVGREGNKQKWKTLSIKADDPAFEEISGNGKRADNARMDILTRMARDFEKSAKEEFINQQEIKGKNPSAALIDRRKITLTQYVNIYWWNDIKKSKPKDKPIRPSTLAFYKYTSENICRYFDSLPKAKQRLYSMDTRTVKDFINYLNYDAVGKNGDSFNKTTILRHWQTFRNIISAAVRDEYIMRDPCINLKDHDKPSTPKYDGDFLDDTQAREFIQLLDRRYNECLANYEKAIPEKIRTKNKFTQKEYCRGVLHSSANWRCMMNLLIQHGLRRGECIGLRWCDLDSETIDGKKYYTLSINSSVTPYSSDKGNYYVGDPKTSSSKRTILIQPEIHAMLMEIKKMREEDYHTTILPSSDEYIFCRDGDSRTPMYPSAPTRWLSRFVKENNLPDISPHDLRRTWATLANEAGVNQKAMQATLGHSDGADTESKHYVKMTLKGQINTLNTMHAVFYGESDKDGSTEEKKA